MKGFVLYLEFKIYNYLPLLKIINEELNLGTLFDRYNRENPSSDLKLNISSDSS